MFMKRFRNAPLRKRFARLAWSNMSNATPSAILLPHTCSKRVMAFARSRNHWDTKRNFTAAGKSLMNEDKPWESYFDMDAECFHRHAGFISFRTLSTKRAKEILDDALREGLKGMSKTNPSKSQWSVWELCNRFVSAGSEDFIDPETARTVILEFLIK